VKGAGLLYIISFMNSIWINYRKEVKDAENVSLYNEGVFVDEIISELFRFLFNITCIGCWSYINNYGRIKKKEA
jgi:hypothetical protein